MRFIGSERESCAEKARTIIAPVKRAMQLREMNYTFHMLRFAADTWQKVMHIYL